MVEGFAPLLRRVLAAGVVVAALCVAILGVAAPAQEPQQTAEPAQTPEPESTPEATPTPTPTETPTPTPTPTATPKPKPSPTGTTKPTPSPTGTPKATPSPTGTPKATPAPTPGATAWPTPRPTATPRERRGRANAERGERGRTDDRRRRRERTNTRAGKGRTERCSGSTSGRDCRRRADTEPQRRLTPKRRLNRRDGSPARSNPGYALSTPGPARVGVPNFFIDKFRIPPFLVPIYEAAGMQYGVRWEILAAINEIETDYGRNLNISSAGARGWMQFMPSTWEAYGVDGNHDGVKDPYNPVDAIFAAARYLRAAGAEQDIRRAVFAYNHADWYVDSVLMRARLIGGMPSDLVGSLSGLTQGRFPVHAKATYAAQLERRRRRDGNAAVVVESDSARRGIRIFSRANAPAIAVNDGKVVDIGRSWRLGRFLKLQDVHGNTYTYGHLGEVARTYPAPKERSRRRAGLPARPSDARPGRAASTTSRPASTTTRAADVPPPIKERLFANPSRPNARAAGGYAQLAGPSRGAPLGFDPRHFTPRPLRIGSRVIGGTVLGRLAPKRPGAAPHLLFEIRPAGRGAPRIDPKPILDGWKLLESTAVYRAAGKNPFFGRDARNPTIGQILLLSKQQLVRRVLADPRIDVYGCGRGDIRSGIIDRRVLATLLYLATSGLKPTVTSLKCGHGYFTSSGNVSHHSTGTAVDIAAINGITITPATQGRGSITDITIQRLLTLQSTMRPSQIISLMEFEGTDNTVAMGDHHDHIHVGWQPLYGHSRRAARRIDAVLKPSQWIKLIDRLGAIDNPEVREQPSRFSVDVVKRASRAHHGE